MDRASDYGSEGWEFESLRARHIVAVVVGVMGLVALLCFAGLILHSG